MQPMARDHSHADIELNFLFAGSVRYFLAGRFVTVPAGRLAAFWAAIPHQVVAFAPGTEVGWVCIPVARVLAYDLGPASVSRLLAGELVVDSHDRPEDGARLRQWAEDVAARDPEALATFALEVQARVRRLLRVGCHQPAERLSAAAARIEDITSWIGEHVTESLTVASIARAVGLNPTYAMSLFRAQCGMSIWQYVTRLRLAHAQRLLATTRRTALDIALASGFGSQTRFYDVFRRELGMAPGEFRRRQEAVAPLG